MLLRWLTILLGILSAFPRLADAQTLLELSSILPGTEEVQLVYNGDFQFSLNIDGQALPSDWYLRLADSASRMLRGDIQLQAAMPIAP